MSNRMYKVRFELLPTALVNSREFSELTAVKQSNFSSRVANLINISRICLGFREDTHEKQSLMQNIDDLALDVSAALSLGDADRQVSPWLVHSSWTFQCSATEIRECLNEVRDSIKLGFLDLEGQPDRKCISQKIAEFGITLEYLLEKFKICKSFCCAVAILIVIDSTLAALLSYLTIQRVNKLLLN